MFLRTIFGVPGNVNILIQKSQNSGNGGMKYCDSKLYEIGFSRGLNRTTVLTFKGVLFFHNEIGVDLLSTFD